MAHGDGAEQAAKSDAKVDGAGVERQDDPRRGRSELDQAVLPDGREGPAEDATFDEGLGYLLAGMEQARRQ